VHHLTYLNYAGCAPLIGFNIHGDQTPRAFSRVMGVYPLASGIPATAPVIQNPNTNKHRQTYKQKHKLTPRIQTNTHPQTNKQASKQTHTHQQTITQACVIVSVLVHEKATKTNERTHTHTPTQDTHKPGSPRDLPKRPQ